MADEKPIPRVVIPKEGDPEYWQKMAFVVEGQFDQLLWTYLEILKLSSAVLDAFLKAPGEGVEPLVLLKKEHDKRIERLEEVKRQLEGLKNGNGSTEDLLGDVRNRETGSGDREKPDESGSTI